MDVADRLERTIDEYNKLHLRMVKAPFKGDDSWKREFVGLRRELQALLSQIGDLSNELAGAGLDAGTSALFRECLVQMRHKVALHQADWPVVHINSDDPVYRASVEGVREANQKFLAVADGALKSLRSGAKHRDTRS